LTDFVILLHLSIIYIWLRKKLLILYGVAEVDCKATILKW